LLGNGILTIKGVKDKTQQIPTNYPKTRALALSALFACILAISSIISIPIPGPVPITLQVFVVLLITMILGSRIGALSCLIYLVIGAVGIPVYAGMSAGLVILFGPTGGYLFGFVAGTFLGGLFCRSKSQTKKKELIRLCLASATALGIIYFVGVTWLIFYFHLSLYSGILIGVVPFIGVDVIKAAFAVPISLQIRKTGLPIPTA
jgi:biotin transport system substrate-specific component